VDAFEAGDVDLVPVDPWDATWMAYDAELGPQLRRTTAFAVQYYGFNTVEAPFDDLRVRQAVAWAVDWARLVRLGDPNGVVATSLVPAGIEGRGEGDFRPRHAPAAARSALAAAGYPGGAGFPPVTLVTTGTALDAGLVADLRRELGIELQVEVRPFEEFDRLLDEDPPQMWHLGWSADFPHPHDFLGLLLESGSRSNVGDWSNRGFDDAMDRAASTGDITQQTGWYEEAQRIVAEEVPLVPLEYPQDWWLSRTELLGARDPGLGIIRYAGLSWAP
jgi:oligopeptide transport system substrate-binding protein